MLRLPGLFKDYRESQSFSALVNIAEFIDPTTFCTKSGEVGMVLSIKGPDVECREPAEIAELTKTLASGLRRLDERYLVNTSLVKRSRPAMQAPKSSNPIYLEAAKNRLAHLTAKGEGLYSYEHYMTVMSTLNTRLMAFGRNPIGSLKRALSVGAAVSSLDSIMIAAARKLRSEVNGFIDTTRDCLEARALETDEIFLLWRRLLNPAPTKARAIKYSKSAPLDFLLVDSQLECHPDHLRLDNYFVKTLTLKQLPPSSVANMLSALRRVKSNMVISTEWRPLSTLKALGLVRSKRRHFHNTKISFMSQVGKERPVERDLLYDNSKEASTEELGECLSEINRGVRLGEFTLTVVILGHSLEEAERSAAEVMKVVGIQDGAMNEERYNGLNAFLASLPGGHPYNLRKLVVTDENYADLVLWFQPSEGEKEDTYLG